MVTVLLDTHVVLWAAQQPERIPAGVRARLESAERRVVSAASAYEIAYKTRIGKLPAGEAILAGWRQVVGDLRLTEAALSVGDMTDAGRLDWDHGDPFDRMLVAHARRCRFDLVTKDERMRTYDPAPTIPWE